MSSVSDKEELFYIRDSRSDVGSSAMFWMSEGGGYTSDLTKAWKVPREKAVAQHNSRETDIPVRCDLADSHSYRAVDMQGLRNEAMGDGMNYVVWKGCYDGNNVRFASRNGSSFNLAYVEPVTMDEAKLLVETSDGKFIAYSAECVERLARSVVCERDVPTKVVLRKAKIKMNSALLARNNRPCSGKHRGNCPECGRITWDYNPYEPAYCKEHRSY